jgi:hypothetical protein
MRLFLNFIKAFITFGLNHIIVCGITVKKPFWVLNFEKWLCIIHVTKVYSIFLIFLIRLTSTQ